MALPCKRALCIEILAQGHRMDYQMLPVITCDGILTKSHHLVYTNDGKNRIYHHEFVRRDGYEFKPVRGGNIFRAS